MKQIKSVMRWVIAASSLTLLISGLAVASDSTQVGRPTVAPMEHKVVVADETKCVKTAEEEYNVNFIYYSSAYPSCPPNMVLRRINLESKRSGLDVTTYVTAICCPHELQWQETSKEAGKKPMGING